MSLVTLGSSTYNTDYRVDIDAIIDRIKRAAAGEQIQGVHVFNFPETVLIGNPKPAVKSANSSLLTYGLLAVMAFILLKPSKKNG